MPELLLVVAEFLTEEERRPAPEDIADSLRVDPARPLLNELEDEGLVVDPEFLKEEEPLLRPPV
jgi:Mn-dependent DtxR family transcriptional regulator